jgi:hypothetical protein
MQALLQGFPSPRALGLTLRRNQRASRAQSAQAGQLIDLRATGNLLKEQLCQCNHYLTRRAWASVES